MMHILKQYEQQIEATEIQRDNFLKKEKYLPALRLLSFLFMVVLLYKFLVVSEINYVLLAFVALVTLLLLTWRDNRLKDKIENCNRLIQICRNEIKSMNGDYSAFESGDEYLDTAHRYSYDLDIFGKNSLFHCVNRSVTIFGKNRLSEYFKSAYDFKDQILERQKAVSELSDHIGLRQQIQLIFFDTKSDEKDRLEFNGWLESDPNLLHNRTFNLIRFALPAITLTLIVLSVLNLVVPQIPIMMVILQLFIVSLYSRKTIKAQLTLSSKVKSISKYAAFFLLIEQNRFKAPVLVNLQRRLSNQEGDTPSKSIKQLSSLLNWMDANLNIIASLILNGLFLFNLQILVALEKWKERYRATIPAWYDILGEFDALASLANFSFNNPDYIIPEVVNDKFLFSASDLGHPLIPAAECVTNSIEISDWNQYCIITGANMSGKSTFLRTVGTNYILAMMGAPVFAAKFVFYPMNLHSSIRTNDSLARKESFFYAELKRLKEIISELGSGQRIFILLDEILKGTNSKDKQAGSIAFLEQLIKYHSVGLIATHDLILGDLISSYPGNIQNLCFEIQIVNDQMSIDYKLHEGVCQNLNATYLMKKMGILIESEGIKE